MSSKFKSNEQIIVELELEIDNYENAIDAARRYIRLLEGWVGTPVGSVLKTRWEQALEATNYKEIL